MNKARVIAFSVFLSCALGAPVASMLINAPHRKVTLFADDAGEKIDRNYSYDSFTVVSSPAKSGVAHDRIDHVVKQKQAQPEKECRLHMLEAFGRGFVLICDVPRTPNN